MEQFRRSTRPARPASLSQLRALPLVTIVLPATTALVRLLTLFRALPAITVPWELSILNPVQSALLARTSSSQQQENAPLAQKDGIVLSRVQMLPRPSAMLAITALPDLLSQNIPSVPQVLIVRKVHLKAKSAQQVTTIFTLT
jgi:hypothetical protein